MVTKERYSKVVLLQVAKERARKKEDEGKEEVPSIPPREMFCFSRIWSVKWGGEPIEAPLLHSFISRPKVLNRREGDARGDILGSRKEELA